jgi:Protein of unknown function (DUF3307)
MVNYLVAMLISLTSVLVLIASLQLKHFICDGPLQTKAMVDGKSVYGNATGVLHSVLHAIGTAVVFLATGYGLKLAASMALADFVIHYHVDWSKENIVKRAGWTTQNPQFWWALSADQMLHQFTYLGLAAWALTA